MPFAFTWASSRFMVSFGPWLLRIVINPPAAIACTPHSHIAMANTKFRNILRRPPLAASANQGHAPKLRRRMQAASTPASPAHRNGWRLPRIGSTCRTEPQRFDHDSKYVGVVQLPAHAVAAGPRRGQNDVFARMHVGIDHGREIAEAKRGAWNALVTVVRDERARVRA